MKEIKKILHIIVLVSLSICLVGSFYFAIYFENESVEELLFYINNGVTQGSISVYAEALKICIPFFIISVFVLYCIFYNCLGTKEIILKRNFFNKKRKLKIYPFTFINNHRVIFTVILSIIILIITIFNMKVDEFVINSNRSSDFIENYYVNPSSNNVEFDKKRNLIYIIVESLETTFFTKKQGGDWDYEVMPELYKLSQEKDSIYFSKNNLTSGVSDLFGTSWTTASLVAHNTGLPFKVPIDGNSYHSNNFMNGAYSIGDILKDKGYYNEMITSSRASFGGVKEFFQKHGQYNILDVDNAEKYGYDLKERDKNTWGFNDYYLFKIAKDRLLKVSKKDKPFNMSLITIDCHHTDGIVGHYTVDKYDSQYENVYRTESILISDFIKWVKKQDFYKDTTIVIVGDHLSMQTEFFKEHNASKRTKFNLIINPVKHSENTKNRIFTALDMYPTTLSAMGAKIKGDRLGLGTDLFSDKLTLSEKFGLETVNKELEKKSKFYNNYILGKDYNQMLKTLEQSEE